MGYLKMECGTCGGSWNIYHYEEFADAEAARTCPHCYAQIGQAAWECSVMTPFSIMNNANGELMNDSFEDGTPQFRMNYVEGTTDPAAEELADIRARLEELEAKLDGMTDPLTVALLEGRI